MVSSHQNGVCHRALWAHSAFQSVYSGSAGHQDPTFTGLCQSLVPPGSRLAHFYSSTLYSTISATHIQNMPPVYLPVTTSCVLCSVLASRSSLAPCTTTLAWPGQARRWHSCRLHSFLFHSFFSSLERRSEANRRRQDKICKSQIRGRS